MVKLATLSDDFQDGTIDPTKWTVASGTVAETGGREKLTPGTTFAIVKTATTYDFSNSQVIVHIPVITANGSTGSLQSGIGLRQNPTNLVGMRKVGSQLICTKTVAGVETQLSFTPYDATNHLFWRMRADASNIYWETSATGTSFSIQNTASIASVGILISAMEFFLFSGYSGVEAIPGTFQIESVNPGLPLRADGSRNTRDHRAHDLCSACSSPPRSTRERPTSFASRP